MVDQRLLGENGPAVGCLGYGAMVLEGYYGQANDEQAVRTIQKAMELGMRIDSADAYGNGHNEALVARALAGRHDRKFIATKFGIVFDGQEDATEVATGWGFSLPINGTPAYVHKALDASLARLGVDCVDLWYAHYPDPSVPIEETVGAMAEGVRAGKVLYLGLSNVTAEQVRRAHRVHPISAVQYEYSMCRREAEADLIPTLRELGIALVAWSPLGSGFLTGTMGDLEENDFRKNNPRFAGRNLEANRERFAPVLTLAKELEATPAQLALAWLLHQGEDIVPIPGTRRSEHLDENARAASIALPSEILERINELAPPGLAEGATLM